MPIIQIGDKMIVMLIESLSLTVQLCFLLGVMLLFMAEKLPEKLTEHEMPIVAALSSFTVTGVLAATTTAITFALYTLMTI